MLIVGIVVYCVGYSIIIVVLSFNHQCIYCCFKGLYMKKTSTQPAKPTPRFKWQTDAYARHATYEFVLPHQFLLWCRLMNITPRDLIIDFMDNLACESWKREGRTEAKDHLINYCIAHGYGQPHYAETEIRQIFSEMDAMGMLFPFYGNMKMINLYNKWSRKQHRCWFKHWYRKPGHKISL